MRFRKRPTEINAEQYMGLDHRPVAKGACLGDGECMHNYGHRVGFPHVTTLQGINVKIAPGEWIIQENEDPRRFYPCADKAFQALYERIN